MKKKKKTYWMSKIVCSKYRIWENTVLISFFIPPVCMKNNFPIPYDMHNNLMDTYLFKHIIESLEACNPFLYLLSWNNPIRLGKFINRIRIHKSIEYNLSQSIKYLWMLSNLVNSMKLIKIISIADFFMKSTYKTLIYIF